MRACVRCIKIGFVRGQGQIVKTSSLQIAQILFILHCIVVRKMRAVFRFCYDDMKPQTIRLPARFRIWILNIAFCQTQFRYWLCWHTDNSNENSYQIFTISWILSDYIELVQTSQVHTTASTTLKKTTPILPQLWRCGETNLANPKWKKYKQTFVFFHVFPPIFQYPISFIVNN